MVILALQVDGTNEYAFLIDENVLKQLVFKTYNDILEYFEAKENDNKQQIEPLDEPNDDANVSSNAIFLIVVIFTILIFGFIFDVLL